MSAAAALPAGPPLPLAQSLAYGVAPHAFFRGAWRRYGDVFTARVVGETWVVLAHPDGVRDVFALRPDDADSGQANVALRVLLGTRGLLLLDGDAHLARRRLVNPAFHGDRLRGYQELVRDVAVQRLSAPIDRLAPVAGELTLEVVLRGVFGSTDPARLAPPVRAALRWLTELRQVLVFGILGPERLMRLPGFRRMIGALDVAVAEEIARRRSRPGDDILSSLIAAGLDDRELRDELVTLLVAGHETTAALIGWAAAELGRAPAWQDRLAEDEDGAADAVVTETLRLWPPVPLVVRRLRRPASVMGVPLPAGATLAPCSVLVHRRPDLYEQPDAFRPERFLGRRPSNAEWFPFGGGTRRCVGASFASMEARIVLGELVRRHRITLSGPPAVGRRGIVLVPRTRQASGARTS